MSELKYQLMLNKDMSWVPCYLKSEADKVIARHKYKRCLAMARHCETEGRLSHEFASDASEYMPGLEAGFRRRAEHYEKWHKRWLEIAEKFKTKSTAQ